MLTVLPEKLGPDNQFTYVINYLWTRGSGNLNVFVEFPSPEFVGFRKGGYF